MDTVPINLVLTMGETDISKYIDVKKFKSMTLKNRIENTAVVAVFGGCKIGCAGQVSLNW